MGYIRGLTFLHYGVQLQKLPTLRYKYIIPQPLPIWKLYERILHCKAVFRSLFNMRIRIKMGVFGWMCSYL